MLFVLRDIDARKILYKIEQQPVRLPQFALDSHLGYVGAAQKIWVIRLVR